MTTVTKNENVVTADLTCGADEMTCAMAETTEITL